MALPKQQFPGNFPVPDSSLIFLNAVSLAGNARFAHMSNSSTGASQREYYQMQFWEKKS
jgi:hypothetical protein